MSDLFGLKKFGREWTDNIIRGFLESLPDDRTFTKKELLDTFEKVIKEIDKRRQWLTRWLAYLNY